MGLGLDDVAWPYNKLREMTKCHPLLFPVRPVCLSPYRSVGRHVEWSSLLYPPGSLVEPRLRCALSELDLATRSASKDQVSFG